MGYCSKTWLYNCATPDVEYAIMAPLVDAVSYKSVSFIPKTDCRHVRLLTSARSEQLTHPCLYESHDASTTTYMQ